MVTGVPGNHQGIPDVWMWPLSVTVACDCLSMTASLCYRYLAPPILSTYGHPFRPVRQRFRHPVLDFNLFMDILWNAPWLAMYCHDVLWNLLESRWSCLRSVAIENLKYCFLASQVNFPIWCLLLTSETLVQCLSLNNDLFRFLPHHRDMSRLSLVSYSSCS